MMTKHSNSPIRPLGSPRLVARMLAVTAVTVLLAASCASDAADAPGIGDASPTASAPATSDGADGAGSADPDGDDKSMSDGNGTNAGDDGSASDGDSAGDSADTGASGQSSDESSGATAEDSGAGSENADEGSDGPDTAAVDDPDAGRDDRGTGAMASARTLERFDGCGPMLEYLRTNASAAVGPWGFGGAFGMDDAGMREEGGVMLSAATADEAAPLRAGADYSTSNVQEAGIDEPDVAKTDGRRLVIAAQNRVQVVDVSGPAPVLAGSVTLGDEWVSRLLLHGDRVLVFTDRWDALRSAAESGDGQADGSGGIQSDARIIGPESGWGPVSEAVEVDLSGAAPTIVRRLRIEGSYVSARMTDGIVRLVTSSRPHAIPWAVPERSGLVAQERAAEANREIIGATTVDDWLPSYQLTDGDGVVTDGGRLVACDSMWAPQHYAGPGTLSVTTIAFGADGLGGAIDTASILADGSTVYASSERLYVTTTEWLHWGAGLEEPDVPSLATTEIHAFDISDPAVSAYLGSATVPGTVLNQYSLSEHDGHLRIATTTAPPWGRSEVPNSESLVTVLAAGPDGLAQVGQVDGLGVGERIYAVRYLGDIAAVVTFRQVDPLYLLDLSDPAAPAVRGELKITGYSAYLHPVGSDLLLGVGQEASLEGQTLGTQVSLFDIADLADPQRIDQWTLPGGHSQVEFNALAFLYWPPEELAVLPVTQYSGDEADASPPFIGAVALGTESRRLTERARLSVADAPTRHCYESREIITRPDGTTEEGEFERHCWFDQDWDAQVVASLVVGDSLLTVTHKGLAAADLATLNQTAFLAWPR